MRRMLLKYLSVPFILWTLIGCGGSGVLSEKSDTDVALKKIVDFKEGRSSQEPTVELYRQAGFDFVNQSNIRKINALVYAIEPQTPLIGESTEDFIKSELKRFYSILESRDEIAPEITLNGAQTITIQAGESFNDPGAEATDDLDGKVPVRIEGSVDVQSPGVYTLTYIAVDKAGNRAEATRTVIVRASTPADTKAPEITLNGAQTITIQERESFSDPGARAVDDVDGEVAVTVRGSVNTDQAGTYTLTYIAVDKAGNHADATRTVIVQASTPADTKKPVITLNGSQNMTVSLGSVFNDPGARAVDDVDGEVAVTVEGSVDTSTIGSYEIVYTARDSVGNTAQAKRYVEVQVPTSADTKKPEITLNGAQTITIQERDSFSDPGARAVDDVDGEVAVTVEGSVNTDKAGTYTLTYIAIDKAGNRAEATRTVIVRASTPADTKKPEITLNGAQTITIQERESFNDPGARAVDDVDGEVAVTVEGSVNTDKAGTYTLTYIAIDKAGNRAEATRTVIVRASTPADTKAPEITLNGAQTITIQVGESFNDPGARAVDDVDGEVAVTVRGSVNTDKAGTYTLTYIAIDKASNRANATRRVEVVTPSDTNAPTITLIGDNPMDVLLGDAFIDPGAVASDNEEGNITQNIQITGEVNTSKIGEYVIYYNVSDSAGNVADEKKRTVRVVAPTPSYTMADITALLEQAAKGERSDVAYVVIHDSNRDNVDGMLAYYGEQLQKINVNFIEEVKGGQTSQAFLSDKTNVPGSATLESFKANPAISNDGDGIIVEYGLGRNDRRVTGSYEELKGGIKAAIEAIRQAKPKAMVFFVTPKHHPVDDFNENANGKNDLRRAYAELSDELGVPLLDMQKVALPQDVAPDPNDYYPGQNAIDGRDDYFYKDAIHFNASGGRRVVNYIFSNIGGPTLFEKMTLEEFPNAGSGYVYKTVDEINKGLNPMNLKKATTLTGGGASEKIVWFAFKNTTATEVVEGATVNFININTAPGVLYDSTGAEVAIGMEIIEPFSGINGNNYLGAPNDIVPTPLLTTASWYIGDAGLENDVYRSQLRFSGLDPQKSYTIELGAIRVVDGNSETQQSNRTGIYTVNGVAYEFNADDANDRSLLIEAIAPDANGTISIVIEPKESGTYKFAYLGWLKLILP